ncbi:prepilin peptidase [Actinomadura darangshiensis]|uniref:Prepilin peptidase n=1 Tax=Actinomadura darangshiensis TaxID=705336 RepID=A0A4R5B7G5_9ACTN|nr:A24 family peptidase [Actinomadura darangshiensis]TDD79604.1 prepilin peptidase [Actinomadura darangshiensis]
MNAFLVVPLAALGGLAVGWFLAPQTERYCDKLTARRRWAIAVTTAAVFAALGWRFGASPVLPAYLYFGAVGTLLNFIDLAVKRLPDPFTLPSYGIGAALLAAAIPFVDDGVPHFVHAVIGMAALWVIYFLQHFFMPQAIGRGDMKLSGVLGLYLGWLGSDAWVYGLVAGAVLGGVVAVGLVLLRRKSWKSELPYGPFMLAGTLIGILAAGG